MNTIFLNHNHPVTTIAPGKQYANEIADLAHDKTKKLNPLCEDLIAESKKLIKATKWAQKTYPHGPRPFQQTTATQDLLADALREVDNLATYFPTQMPYARYRPLRRCIHCKGKHNSEDHHLSLGIPTLPDPDPENIPTAAPPIAITPKQDNTNDRYKMLGAPLPNQQLAYHQWQITTQPPPPSSTNSPSPRSTLNNASFTFTRRLLTSSISNPTSDYQDSSYHRRQGQGP